MKTERRQSRRARIVASPHRQSWNSIQQAILLKDGAVRAMCPAGQLRVSKGQARARSTRSSWTAKEMSGWEETRAETAFRNLRATENFSGNLAIAGQGRLRVSRLPL